MPKYEKILNNAICTEPIDDNVIDSTNSIKNEKYKYKDYKPTPHEYIEKLELKKRDQP